MIDLESLERVVRFDDTINADSTIALFDWDNARFDRSRAAQAYIENSRYKLDPRAPYEPNLSLIERLWRFFQKEVLYNRYYESFDTCRKACKEFFGDPQQHQTELRLLLTESFEITGR